MIIKRKSDGKLLNVSDKEVRVYESMYTVSMNVDIDPRLAPNKSDTEFKDDAVNVSDQANPNLKPELDKNMVASIKYLREHKLELPGRSQGDMTEIEKSAIYGNGQFQNEGLYLDQVVQSDVDQLASIIAETTMRGTSLKESILKAIRQLRPQKEEGELVRGKSRRSKRRKNEKRTKARNEDTPMTGESNLSSTKRSKLRPILYKKRKKNSFERKVVFPDETGKIHIIQKGKKK